MQARVSWVEKRTFLGESGSGHVVPLGTTAGPDGKSLMASPMELVLIGTGGCSAFDVVHILEKGREPVTGCRVELDAERAAEDPKVFIKIHMKFVVTGRGLDRRKVERAIALSREKYCSASAMIAKTAEITHELELRDS